MDDQDFTAALSKFRSAADWLLLAIAFVFSSSASSLVLIKTYLVQNEKPKWWLVLNSALTSGLMAVMVVAWISDYDTSLSKRIAIAIFCGFSGDAVLRAIVTGLLDKFSLKGVIDFLSKFK